MIEQYRKYVELFDAREPRERGLILLTLIVVIACLWWWFVGAPMLAQIKALQQTNQSLESEALALESTAQQIEDRIRQGINSAKQQRLEQLRAELTRVRQTLQQQTFELIEPDDMFSLMQEMLSSETKLKLTHLRRSQVNAVFSDDDSSSQQPEIFRHVMSVGFEGRYQDIVRYISRLETLDWKLIWDRIELKTGEYPTIGVEIEISTLSDSRQWVGL